MFSQTGIGTEGKKQGKNRPCTSYDLVIIPFKMLLNYCIENRKCKKGVLVTVIKGVTVAT